MTTLNRHAISPERLHEAVKRLREGLPVAFPTETFYALGADATSEAACVRVRELKQRSEDAPMAVLISDAVMLRGVVASVPPAARSLMAKWWPGPLTLVLPAAPELPRALLGPGVQEVGVRISPHPVTTALVRAFGRPLTATSCNRTGDPPARTTAEAQALDESLLVIEGESTGKQASTVVRFEDGRPVVLREGPIRI